MPGLVDAYRKWDHFGSDSESESSSEGECSANTAGDAAANSISRLKPPAATRFDAGEGNFSALEQQLFDEEMILKLKRLEKDPNEVWQVCERQLEAWVASSKPPHETASADLLPCRPWTVLVCQLFPVSGLLRQELMNPPEEPPSDKVMAGEIASAMLDPSSGCQRRPGKIVFPAARNAEQLCMSLKAVGVETSVLGEAEGISEFVTTLSERLVHEGLASVGPDSHGPGLLSVEGVSPGAVAGLFQAAAALAEEASDLWEHLHPRHALELRLGGGGEEPERAWLALLGSTKGVKEEAGSADGGRAAPPRGLAIFFSRLDCEARVMEPGRHHEVWRPQPCCAWTGEKGGRSSASGGGDTEQHSSVAPLKRTRPRTYDLASGQELCYVDAEAQRKHWPHVRGRVHPLSERYEGMRKGRQHWWGHEVVLFYREASALQFSDLDAILKYGWPIADDRCVRAAHVYPLPMEFPATGPARRPSLASIKWLGRACLVLLQVAQDPSRLNKFGSRIKLELGGEMLTVSADPVVLTSEMEMTQAVGSTFRQGPAGMAQTLMER
ncbi:unnamed protein product [Chrysoparadoxa australica]